MQVWIWSNNQQRYENILKKPFFIRNIFVDTMIFEFLEKNLDFFRKSMLIISF